MTKRELGQAGDAIDSICSDLDKHPQTRGHGAIELSMGLRLSGNLSTCEEVAKFI